MTNSWEELQEGCFAEVGVAEENKHEGVQCPDCHSNMGSCMAETPEDGLGPAYVCLNCNYVNRI